MARLLTVWPQASKRERSICQSRSFRCLRTEPQKLHGGTSTTLCGSKEITKSLFPRGTSQVLFNSKSLYIIFTSHVPPLLLLLSRGPPLSYEVSVHVTWTGHFPRKEGKSLFRGSLHFAFSLAPTPSLHHYGHAS